MNICSVKNFFRGNTEQDECRALMLI